MNSIQKDIITILKGYLRKDYSFTIENDINDIKSLANKYTITQIIGYTLRNTNKYNTNIFDETIFSSTNRYECQKYLRSTIKNTLEKHNIGFVFIKGYTLGKYYDEPYLRYSSDVDVVVQKDNYLIARDYLVNEGGFKQKHFSENELSLVNNNGYSVDLHCMFCKPGDPNEELFKDVDYYSENHELNNEYKLFHLCSHGAKHIRNGFIAFQFLLDMYYLNKLDMNTDYLHNLLTNGNLITFYNETTKLINVLFNDNSENNISNLYIEYLFNSSEGKGRENYVRVNRSKDNSSKIRYIFSRIFQPYEILVKAYPKLENKRYLTPVYHIIRAYDIITSNRINAAKDEIKFCIVDTKENTDKVKELFNNLGI